MADNDNKELMQLLEKQFEGIYKKLDDTASKDDIANFATKDDIEDVKRHTGVLIEAIEHKIDIVIEGVMAVNEKLDRRTGEHEQEHAQLEKRVLINSADISKLDQRVGKLEGRV